jgi:hypothetical protein
MAGIHCSQCQSLINTDTSSSSAPPWCPTCGADFQAAPNEAALPAPAPARPAKPAPRAPEAAAPRPRVAAPPARRAPQVPPSRQPRPKAPLPAGVPAEVKALGHPEQVHAPDECQARRNRLLLRGMAGALGLVVLALAGFLWWASDNPAPGLPPPDVALGIAFSFAVLGLLTTATSFIPWGGHWGAPATFLVYENALVELRAGRHRVIPWDQIGSQRQTSPLLAYYRFPVRGGKAIHFDNTVQDHAALCETIRDRAAEFRSLGAFGGEAAVVEMADAKPGPFFLVQRTGGGGGVYRVTFLGSRLLFYRMAYGEGISSGRPPEQMGALEAWASAGLHDKFLAEMRVLDEADGATLLHLAAESDESFAVSADDVRELHIDPPSTKKYLLHGLYDTPHEGQLKLVHARRGTITFAFLFREQVLLATQELPRLFGDAVKVNVVWSDAAYKFVARA